MDTPEPLRSSRSRVPSAAALDVIANGPTSSPDFDLLDPVLALDVDKYETAHATYEKAINFDMTKAPETRRAMLLRPDKEAWIEAEELHLAKIWPQFAEQLPAHDKTSRRSLSSSSSTARPSTVATLCEVNGCTPSRSARTPGE
jgi:hypothetical protein